MCYLSVYCLAVVAAHPTSTKVVTIVTLNQLLWVFFVVVQAQTRLPSPLLDKIMKFQLWELQFLSNKGLGSLC